MGGRTRPQLFLRSPPGDSNNVLGTTAFIAALYVSFHLSSSSKLFYLLFLFIKTLKCFPRGFFIKIKSFIKKILLDICLCFPLDHAYENLGTALTLEIQFASPSPLYTSLPLTKPAALDLIPLSKVLYPLDCMPFSKNYFKR